MIAGCCQDSGCWMIAGCCWMMAGCWLIAGWCWMNADCCWDTPCWMIAGCGCRRKSLRIFPGYWWFAAKTILQPEKSLNTSGMLMIYGWHNFAGREVFECFRDVDHLRLRQFCRRKSLWIFPPGWWGKLAIMMMESWREFRLGELAQLTVASGCLKWECEGYLYPDMAQSSDCPIGERHRFQ